MHRRPRPTLLVTFGLVLALLAMGYGALFSMLDDIRDEYGIGESALGAVIGIGFFAGFLSQILIAPLADRGHARQLVLGGMVIGITGLVLMAMARDVVPLLAGRFVMGIGVGMAVPAIRRIVIVAEPERIGHNLGRLLAVDVAGFAAGPAVSALLVGPFGIPAPFLVIAGATALALPFVARNSRVDETAEPPQQRLAFDLLRIRPFTGAVALGCAVWLMIGAFDALWAVVLDDLDTSDWIANLGITLFALPLVIFGSIGGRLAQRVGPFRVGTVGLLLGATFMMLYGLVPSGGAMFAVAMFHSVTDGLTDLQHRCGGRPRRGARAASRRPGRARWPPDAGGRHHRTGDRGALRARRPVGRLRRQRRADGAARRRRRDPRRPGLASPWRPRAGRERPGHHLRAARVTPAGWR